MFGDRTPPDKTLVTNCAWVTSLPIVTLSDTPNSVEDLYCDFKDKKHWHDNRLGHTKVQAAGKNKKYHAEHGNGARGEEEAPGPVRRRGPSPHHSQAWHDLEDERAPGDHFEFTLGPGLTEETLGDFRATPGYRASAWELRVYGHTQEPAPEAGSSHDGHAPANAYANAFFRCEQERLDREELQRRT